MHVGTYPTKNFATFGPSELQPPFTEASIPCLHISFSLYSTGQTSDPIQHVAILQSPNFLVKSRHPHFCVTFRYPFFLRYGISLPSSFNMVHSTPESTRLVHLCRFRVRFFHLYTFPGPITYTLCIHFARNVYTLAVL